MAIEVDENILFQSVKYYGKDIQSVVCMEECSELIQCISKELRDKSDISHLSEEIADVLICIKMLQLMYDIQDSQLQDWVDVKQQRMEERIRNQRGLQI